MIILIAAFAAGCGGFAAARWGFGAGIGWSVFWGILSLVVAQFALGFLVQRRVKAVMNAVQSILLAGQKRLQQKMLRWQMRPPGSVQAAQKEIFADTKVFVQDALAKVDELNRFRWLVPMMDRQIATAKVQLAWMVKDFKTVDALMPKVLLVDPMMTAIKIARLHMTGGDFKDIEKLYRKGVGRVRYNGNVLLAAEMSWIQVKRGDADGAFKTLTEALKKSDDATLKRNHECLMNNRVGHFSNSGLGDQWYSLLLEEPKVHVQRQRSVYR